jgi:hypothetical protein
MKNYSGNHVKVIVVINYNNDISNINNTSYIRAVENNKILFCTLWETKILDVH